MSFLSLFYLSVHFLYKSLFTIANSLLFSNSWIKSFPFYILLKKYYLFSFCFRTLQYGGVDLAVVYDFYLFISFNKFCFVPEPLNVELPEPPLPPLPPTSTKKSKRGNEKDLRENKSPVNSSLEPVFEEWYHGDLVREKASNTKSEFSHSLVTTTLPFH